MPTRLQKVTVTLFWLSVGIVLLWLTGSHLLAGMDYSLISERESPNGKITIHEFRSNHDGLGHAPYGKTLSLSHGSKIKKPDAGFVFFAGYCKDPILYEWNSNETISVRCIDGNRGEGPRTLASVMYGIKVNYSWQ
jgi:hypothetical protein